MDDGWFSDRCLGRWSLLSGKNTRKHIWRNWEMSEREMTCDGKDDTEREREKEKEKENRKQKSFEIEKVLGKND